jgi:hypothetical protein
MAKIKKVITAEQKEVEKQLEIEMQQTKEKLKQRLSQAVKPSRDDINELVLLLAREHGLIEDEEPQGSFLIPKTNRMDMFAEKGAK